MGEVLEPLVVLFLPEPLVPAKPRPSCVRSLLPEQFGLEGSRAEVMRSRELPTSRRGRGSPKRCTGRRRRRPSPPRRGSVRALCLAAGEAADG